MVNHSPAPRFSYIRNSGAVISHTGTHLLNDKANDATLGKRQKVNMSLLSQAFLEVHILSVSNTI